MKVKELLADPDKWTKSAFARSEDGIAIDVHNKRACQFCLVGAIQRCYEKNDRWTIFNRLYALLRKATDISLYMYNDLPGTTHADILTLVNEADV